MVNQSSQYISVLADNAAHIRYTFVIRMSGNTSVDQCLKGGKVQQGLLLCNNHKSFRLRSQSKLTSFSLQRQYAAPSADAVALRWSPDGSHLLLASTAFGLVSLWKVKQA